MTPLRTVTKYAVCFRKFAPGQPAVIKFKTDACQGQKNEVKYLEHVQLVTDLDYTRRGNLALFIQSPTGTLLVVAGFLMIRTESPFRYPNENPVPSPT